MKTKRTDEFAYFNMLKFAGAICIAVFLHYNDHFLPCLGLKNPFEDNVVLWRLSHYSFVAAEMYFIISGILYSHAYMEKIVSGGMRFDDFLKKRAARIFPTLIVTTLVMYLGNLALYKMNGTLWSCGTLSVWELTADCLFGGKTIFNAGNTLNGPIWYVNVLMLCYIVAFLLTRLFAKCRSGFLFVLPILAGVMMQYSDVSFAGWNKDIARGYIAFFVGILLDRIIQNLHQLNKKQSVLLKAALCLELLMAIGVRICPWSGALTGNVNDFYIFLIFPELILLLHQSKIVNRLCATKLLRWCGTISFGIYLWNFPIYLTLHLLLVSGTLTMDVTKPLFFVLVTLIHLVVATASYHLIEKNGKKLVVNQLCR